MHMYYIYQEEITVEVVPGVETSRLQGLLPACLSGREGLEGSTGGCQRGHESCPPRCGHGGHCMSGVCPLASVLLCRVCLSRNAPCVFIVKHQGKVYTEHHLPPTMHPSRP